MATNSWRQYGGIYANEKFQNIGTGTLIADKILIRKQAINNSVINGKLTVTGNIESGESISASDLVVKNAYLTQKIILGSNPGPNPPYMTGNSVNGYIGMNTASPTYALDINSNQGNILALRSSNSIMQNILAENSSKNGLLSTVTPTTVSLGFFVGENVEAGTPTTSLSSTQNKMSITTPSLRLNANVCISNTNSTSSIFNEILTVYDTSVNTYLYDIYQNQTINTGSSLSLVTSDGSANTFMHITTPNKLGGTINAGAFSGDTTRGMLTLGVTNPSFIPTQCIVSGTSAVYNKSTVGFNTFYPKTETYFMDINGPTHIGNGDLTTVFTTNFEIYSMKFSKVNPQIGFAVGSPSSKDANGNFIHTIVKTVNGGKSWSLIGLNNLFGFDTYINIFVYDTNTIYISSRSIPSYVFYSTNGGATFSYVAITNSNRISAYTALYATKNTLFLVGQQSTSSGQSSGTIPLGTITPYTLFYVSTSDLNNSVPLTPITLSQTAMDMDGFGNFLYIVGTGIVNLSTGSKNAIVKYNSSGSLVSTYSTNSSYNCVCAYSETYVIAGGNGIISYTTNGTTWTDVSIAPYNLKSIYIYDTLNAVAVGDNGSFLYTVNGSKSWDPVPTAILNSSGIANQILGSNCNLSGIFMPDINSFVISKVLSPYKTENQNITTPGISNIFYGYFPAILNGKKNSVLDVSGNMGIAGDIIQGGYVTQFDI
jgi:hypothetical protein